ncbi:MAG: lysylphosphatidylglycerol synthase domain-containing protein, partial [Gemmatimonadaceae bacterium]
MPQNRKTFSQREALPTEDSIPRLPYINAALHLIWSHPLSRTRWFLTFGSFIAAIGVSVYVIVSTWPAGGAPLGLPARTHLLLLAGVGAEILFRVAKIYFSARAVALSVSFGASARTILGGDFAASITPSRSGSEPARFLVLSEAKTPVGGIFVILFLELFIEMLSLALVAGVLAVVFHGSGSIVRGLLFTVLLYAAAVLGVGAVATMLARRHASGPPPSWFRRTSLSVGFWRRLQRSLRQLR